MDWTCLLTGMRAKLGTTRAKTMKAAFMSAMQQNLIGFKDGIVSVL